MKLICYAIAVLMVGGCAAQMVALPTPMTVTEVSDGVYRLDQSVTMKAENAQPLVLREGTTWRQIGVIEQGNVFDTKDQVVIVNAFDVHEAAVVTKDGTVRGFYLKVEKTFVAVEPVPITLKLGE